MNVYDIIIVGAGPAGLFAASQIKNSKKILVLEKNPQAGKKLILAGSSRCNITHSGDIQDFFKHYGKNGKFLKYSFNNFSNIELIKFFNQNGLKMVVDKNNKVFPKTQNGKDVLNILLGKLNSNTTIKYRQPVLDIVKKKSMFQIQTTTKQFLCQFLIISTGGKSFPQTGSTGDGYIFAHKFGHKIIPPKPALTSIQIFDNELKTISGISLKEIKIELYRNNKKIVENSGDVIFTHTGLSGPGILDLSRNFNENDLLKLNLIEITSEKFRSCLINNLKEHAKKSIKNYIKEYHLPENLIKIILLKLNINFDHKMADLDKTNRTGLIKLLCEYPFIIKKINGFNQAMVTCGGISLKEISSKTMQSKLATNLYFAGETLDIDGDTGGYNLQAAFSTAFTAAQAINQNVSNTKAESVNKSYKSK